jgi:hypothetical protein
VRGNPHARFGGGSEEKESNLERSEHLASGLPCTWPGDVERRWMYPTVDWSSDPPRRGRPPQASSPGRSRSAGRPGPGRLTRVDMGVSAGQLVTVAGRHERQHDVSCSSGRARVARAAGIGGAAARRDA